LLLQWWRPNVPDDIPENGKSAEGDGQEGLAMRLAFASPTASTLIDGARCWRRARDLGEPVQPVLASSFPNPGAGVLAPVIDGLLTLFEATFRRRFDAGAPCDGDLTGDEERLLFLLDHDDQPTLPGVRPDLVGALRAAFLSTRIMLRLTLPGRADPA
jgi:hypothetical protein